MIPGAVTLGEIAFSTLPAALDATEPSAFAALLADRDAQFVYLCEATPYDAGLPGEQTLRFANTAFRTTGTDTPAHTPYAARLGSSYEADYGAFDGVAFTGRASVDAGAVRIENADGAFDAEADYDWGGRSVTVLAGGPDFALDDFVAVFTGIASSVDLTTEGLTIAIRDRRHLLEKPLQATLYAGTGALEGGTDLADQPKPLTYGRVRGIAPVLIDAANQVYQVHDGTTSAIDVVRDQGVELTNAGDSGDVYTDTVVGGEYVTDLSAGVLRLGATPAGRVTCDVKGDATGGYVERTADIIERLATTAGGLGADDLDHTAIAEMNGRYGGVVGYHVGVEARTVAGVIDELMTAAGGWWLFARSGRLKVQVLKAPSGPVGVIGEADLLTLERRTPVARTWRVRVGYKRVWAPLTEQELAAGVTDADRALLTQEFRFSEANDAGVSSASSPAREVERRTFLDAAADAAAQAALELALFSPLRHVWDVTVARDLFRYWLGDTATLEHSRHGLAAGQDLVVVGLAEDAAGAAMRLELWG